MNATLLKNYFRKIFRDKSLADFPGGYIPNRIFCEQIKDSPILVVGDYKGRDYLPLKKEFSETYLMDISDNGIADGDYFVKLSASEPSGFQDKFFKYILLADVIEHIWEDKKTLEEMNRILSDDGKLLLAVPLYHDYADFHYHIYSPKTISLLLKHSGFEIKSMTYRGLAISTPNSIVAFLSLFFGKNGLKIINSIVYSFHKLLSRFRFPNCLFKNYGTYITAVKGKKVDSLKVQKENFK